VQARGKYQIKGSQRKRKKFFDW